MSRPDPAREADDFHWLPPGVAPGRTNIQPTPGFGATSYIPPTHQCHRRAPAAQSQAPPRASITSGRHRKGKQPRPASNRPRQSIGGGQNPSSRRSLAGEPNPSELSYTSSSHPIAHQSHHSFDRGATSVDSAIDPSQSSHSPLCQSSEHAVPPGDTRLDFFNFNTLPAQDSSSQDLDWNQNFPLSHDPIHSPSSSYLLPHSSFDPFTLDSLNNWDSPFLHGPPQGYEHRLSPSSPFILPHRPIPPDTFTTAPRSPYPQQYSPLQQSLSISTQQSPFTFDPLDSSNSSQFQNPIPHHHIPLPAIVLQRAPSYTPQSIVPAHRQGHHHSRSDTSQASNLLHPSPPFVARPRSSSTPQLHQLHQASTPLAPPPSIVQRPLPTTERRAPAPGITFSPQQLDHFGRSAVDGIDHEAEVNQQALEANQKAWREAQEANQKRDKERADLDGKIATLLEEKRLLNMHKSDSANFRSALQKLDGRLGTARRSLRRFQARCSKADAQHWEYRGDSDDTGQH